MQKAISQNAAQCHQGRSIGVTSRHCRISPGAEMHLSLREPRLIDALRWHYPRHGLATGSCAACPDALRLRTGLSQRFRLCNHQELARHRQHQAVHG